MTATYPVRTASNHHVQTKEASVPDDLQIEKVNDKELRIRLGGNNKVTQATVTVEDLYDQLGKYLQNKKSAGTSAAADSCTINYA
jgi:hypothetical protein